VSSAPLRTAVVGFGTAGRVFHAPLLAALPEFEVTAVVTRDQGRAAEVARLHPGARVVGSVAELDALDLDVVVVASPPALHVEHAAAALRAGRHVVVDKPFAPTAAAAQELLDLAAASSGRLTVFQNRRYDGDFRTVRRLVAEGALGRVLRFESRFEWFKPVDRAGWKSSGPGSGILLDLGTHLVDQAVQLFGPVVELSAELAVWREGVEAVDDAVLTLRHQQGTVSCLRMSALTAQPGDRFRVLGDRAAYVKHSLDPQEAQLAGGVAPADLGIDPEEAWGLLGVPGALQRVPTERGAYLDFYRDLAHAVRTGSALPVDPEDAVAVLRLLETAAASPVHRTVKELIP
jgi:scyllo-inositol 2-dehydrogenase (NADP+)